MEDKKKLIIIEDELSIRDLYSFKFKLEGFDVSVAENGEEGLKIIEKVRPDLILLDLKMPIMNGEDMLEQLRTYDWSKDIKVIVLTNISKDEAPAKLRFLNVERYIVKAHHTPQQIVDIVNEII
jgi:DNA-binding response OmpR family regulator